MPQQSRLGTTKTTQPTDTLLGSIHKISTLLTRPISLDKILTTIVQEISHVFGFTRLAIFLTDRQRNLLECRYIHGFSPQDSRRALHYPYRLTEHDCVETRVARWGKTIYIKDYGQDPRVTTIDTQVSQIMRRYSTIAVPLKIKRDVIGLITADKGDLKLAMTRQDIAAFSTFANQASIVIENARLQTQNQQKIKQLLTLQTISKKVSSAFNPEKLFQAICSGALHLTRASCGLLFLLDEPSADFVLTAVKGKAAGKVPAIRFAYGSGLVGWVAKTGTPLLVGDVRREPLFQEIVAGTMAQITVPMISDKRVLGVLHVSSPDMAAFTEDDLKLLLIFASHSASLIRNIRLYGQVMTERNFRENILESSPNSVITIDLNKEISSINRKAEEMFRIRRNYVLGARIDAVFPPDVAEILTLAIDHLQETDSRELEVPLPNGGTTTFGITSSLLRDHQGALIGAIMIIRDLTAEKKTEELIRRLDRLTSLGQLSAGIAHEIRNPLTSINFNVQLLAKKVSDSAGMSQLLNDTQEGIDRIRILVKGMLDFAKPSVPALKNDSLLRVVQGTIALMDMQLRENRIEVRSTLPDQLPPVILDAHQIRQVLVNLLLNAMEAMPNGGVILVSGQVEQGECPGGDQIVLNIIDQGTGISQENLSRIFNPFFTTKTEGTGLGLSIVHSILELHHATVEVSSKMHQGTTFTLRFPAQPVEVRHATRQNPDC